MVHHFEKENESLKIQYNMNISLNKQNEDLKKQLDEMKADNQSKLEEIINIKEINSANSYEMGI